MQYNSSREDIVQLGIDAWMIGETLGKIPHRDREVQWEDYLEEQWRAFAAAHTFANRDLAYRVFAKEFARGYQIGTRDFA